jgi:ActR/RegA family two-component response regulator
MLFSSSNINGRLESILIVNDDGMILSLLSLGFEKYGFKVLKAENGLDAWNIFISDAYLINPCSFWQLLFRKKGPMV